MRKEFVKGVEQWRELIGKNVSFEWSDGWDDYYPHGVIESVQPHVDEYDPRYPRVYVDTGYGTYAVWESETVEVTIHD